MSAPLSRRRVLQAAVPALAGLAGTAVGAFAMFTATDERSTAKADGHASTRQPTTTEAAPIPTTPSVLLAFTRPTLHPVLEPAARAESAVRTVSIVQGGIADLSAARDDGGGVVERHDPGWAVPLEAIAIDPAVHAEFVPEADRPMVAALGDGQILLGRTSADLRRTPIGGTLEIVGGQKLVVAGIVDDTTVGAAEIAMTTATGAPLGLDTPRYMLMKYEARREELEDALRDALPADVPVRLRAPGESPFLRQGESVLPQVQVKARFGEFAYKRDRPETEDTSDFFQSSEWINDNLVQIDLPIITERSGQQATCHRLVADTIVGALNEISTLNLSNLVKPAEYKGCYNPRFVRDNPWDISRHAWGIAIDLNFESNLTGTESIQDPRVVEVFRRWGFTEGSNWLRPDAGHFEYARIS